MDLETARVWVGRALPMQKVGKQLVVHMLMLGPSIHAKECNSLEADGGVCMGGRSSMKLSFELTWLAYIHELLNPTCTIAFASGNHEGYPHSTSQGRPSYTHPSTIQHRAQRTYDASFTGRLEPASSNSAQGGPVTLT